MISSASRSGSFTRLGKKERLRSQPYQSKQKQVGVKSFRFVLINNA